jgi:uncharacterized membrane protein
LAGESSSIESTDCPASSGTLPEIEIVTGAADPNTRTMNFTKNIGMLLLAIYLILTGLMSLVHFVIPVVVMGILALVAGICILIGK